MRITSAESKGRGESALAMKCKTHAGDGWSALGAPRFTYLASLVPAIAARIHTGAVDYPPAPGTPESRQQQQVELLAIPASRASG